MDDFMIQALEIAKAQARVRPMTPEEFMAYAKEMADGLRGIAVAGEHAASDEEYTFVVVDGMASIKDNSVACLVCGKKGKVLTKAHLAGHGMTPKEYREKYGIRKGTPLMCKALVRARRAKMNDMKLWERRADKRSTMPLDALADMSDE